MPLIIDTDAGIDDAEALLMALRHPDATVAAITTVTGNVHLDKVNPNVCTVLQQVGQSVPVYSGADRPLVEPWFHDERRYHKDDGLGDWDERPHCDVQLESEQAAVALVRLTNATPGEITLVALGPLTNLALALRLDPTLPDRVKHLTIMGGAVDARGNTPTVTAEFNIAIDPEAAYMVFEAFPQFTLVSWEATLANLIPWADHDRLCNLGTPLSRFYNGINVKATSRARARYDGHLLPDPLAMAVTLQPGLVLEQETRHVTVELRGDKTRGQTVVNYGWYTTGKANAHIVRRVDMAGVLRLYESMLSAG